MKDRRFGVMNIAALLLFAFVCVSIFGFTSPSHAQQTCDGLVCTSTPLDYSKFMQQPQPKHDWRDYVDGYVPDYSQSPPPPVRFSPPPVVPRSLPQSDFLYPTLELQLQADAIAAQGVMMDMQLQAIQNQTMQLQQMQMQNQYYQQQYPY